MVCHSLLSSRSDISRVLYLLIVGVCHLSRHFSCLNVQAAYPPAKDGPSLTAGIFGLATYRMCGTLYHYKLRWALTPPFHPYLHFRKGGYFLSHCPRRHRRLSVRKYIALCCPDFPLCHSQSDRPRFCIKFIIRSATLSLSMQDVSRLK